jgi:hypothetical protein
VRRAKIPQLDTYDRSARGSANFLIKSFFGCLSQHFMLLNSNLGYTSRYDTKTIALGRGRCGNRAAQGLVISKKPLCPLPALLVVVHTRPWAVAMAPPQKAGNKNLLIGSMRLGAAPYQLRRRVHVRYMCSEVEPCVLWALRVSLPFLAKLIED